MSEINGKKREFPGLQHLATLQEIMRGFTIKNAKWILVGIGLLILLTGGAYFGAQALANREDAREAAVVDPNTNGGLSDMILDQSEEGLFENSPSGQMIEMEIENAAELPDSEPETAGFILEREDDTLLIGTGEPKISLKINDDGTPNISIDGTEGPSVEVVITHNTKIFEDVSDPTAMFSGESDSFQQEVKLVDSLDDMTVNDATVMVWRTKRGERIIADVVVVTPLIAVSSPFQP